jgi:molybdenum cofactor cytidylyltransferase
MPHAAALVGLLLAAGRGERFGGAKLLAEVPQPGGGTVCVGVASLRRLRAAIPQAIAVVRPHDDALARLFEREGAHVVVALRAGEGMGASLAAGVAAAPIEAAGYIVALADMPWIDPATHARIATELSRGVHVAAPRYRGARGHPVGFAASLRDELTRLGGDEGAKRIVAAHRDELVLVDVDDPGVLRDVDTPADLR